MYIHISKVITKYNFHAIEQIVTRDFRHHGSYVIAS